jgi:AcrR family transcriptional regulator
MASTDGIGYRIRDPMPKGCRLPPMSNASVSDSARPGARELARRAMTSQIAEMAVNLFVERGYDETTVDDICAVAKISRTSFFRYFRSKEDVLMRDFADLGDLLLASLTTRPDDETPWAALRNAIGPLAARYNSDGARTRRALKLVIETPTLGAFHQDKLARWVKQLHPEIARRLGSNPQDLTDPAPNALISAAFACLDAALAAWVAAEGTEDLAPLLDRAMGALA